MGDDGMRRSIRAIMLALATGILISLSPVASAATPAHRSGAPDSLGDFGVRLVDVPVSEADNARALRYIVDFLPVGSVVHRRILILNNERHTERFSVYPDAAHITDGLFVGDSGATRNELTRWISVQHPTVTLAAGASVTDMVTIKVPKGATKGEHYAVVWVQQTAKPSKRSGFALTEISRVGVRVYLAVGRGGAPPTSFDVTSITGRRTASGQSDVVAHVKNTGGRAVDLTGTVRLADGPGNSSSGPFRARKIATLAPGQSWNMVFPLPRSLPEGSWRATVSLVSGITQASGAATVRFAPVAVAQSGLSAMDWIWLALGGLVLLLVLVMGRYALRHRRQALA
jgi:hypothetical protein